ncbi:alpha/beta hydrolase [Micromonospora cathayae]|uniref:Alpha/beta hydrolase n=1 Tax=Micromonospora cathayae TaxID=3028804 RepID=A0ABY7ZLF5_9ACTN|nr:alpha/beta hydrolase [Micromonospora sp. HUAS 3]WDZ83717.1 alpha/beta hydrolase [Micromonospora sp. HUAS 3]
MTEFIEMFTSRVPDDMFTLPIEEQRRLYRSLPDVFVYPRPPGLRVRDAVVPGPDGDVPVRIYLPDRPVAAGVLCYARGDGFCLGDLETHDTVAAELADRTGHPVVSVDVRSAPEHPFPAAVHDVRAVVEALADRPERFGVEPGPIGLVGDSSGGNLMVANCLLARDRGGPRIACHGLVSPVLDFARWQDDGPDAPILSSGEMRFYASCYARDPQDLLDPLVSPLRTARFDGLPPATILATQLDSLRQDSVDYAQRLIEAGVRVELRVEPGLVHAPLRARSMCPAAARAWTDFCASVGRLLRQAGSAAAHPPLVTQATDSPTQ